MMDHNSYSIANTNIKYEIFKNFFNNNNLRNEYEKVKFAFHLILVLNEVDLSKIQFVKDRFINSYSSFPSISSFKNFDSDNKIQEEIADSIIWVEDTIYRNFCSWSFLINN
jgi:hypothetical protein